MPRKLTKEEFINRESDILNGDYEFIGEYKGANIKTLFKHSVCGYEWMIRPSIFHQGSRCPQCSVLKRSKKISLTKEEFIEREGDIKSGEYEMLGDYVGSLIKTLFRHNFCGYEWELMPNKFKNGVRCPKCANINRHNKQSLTKEEFYKREEDIQSGEYTMLGKYVNSYTKMLFKHNKCGYEWEIRPGGFYSGERCPRCQGRERFTKETFCEREDDIQSGEYEMLGYYVNTVTEVLFRHTICGHEWETLPCHFHQGSRCPRCNQSRGEKRIDDVLKLLNISFEAQKRFDSCRYKNTLPFDFYVNNSFLIEYDGEQHFKPINFAGKGNEWADKKFKLGQLRDNIKTKWAKDNGIPLVRIPYTEFDNIEQIIKDSIEKYSIQKAG